MSKSSPPPVYKATMPVRKTPETMSHEMGKAAGKPGARYPHKPLGNQPGGGGSTK